jgi:Tol biopolymer transport system component
MLRRMLVAASLVLVAACGDNTGNPLSGLIASRPPSAEAALVFVSGSWADVTGGPRELLALDPDGSKVERLTSCSSAAEPCDFLSAALGPDRTRILAIRTSPGSESGASALYYMDLARSVETILVPQRRVGTADFARDGSFIIYSGVAPQGTQEDLYTSQLNGTQEQNLTQSVQVREIDVRIDPFGRTAVFERIDASGVSRIALYPDTPLTSGPATGPALPGTPYLVGADADPAFSPDGTSIAFRRLTGVGNGGLGTWDLLTLVLDGVSEPRVIVSGALSRGAPDWGAKGILYVETDAAASRSQLVLVQPDGSAPTVLRTEDAAYRMGAPRWLPGS